MLKDQRILVVEDDPEVAEIIEWNLFAAGYPVTIVQDGLSALRAFDTPRPALVTIDLNVPEVSGFRLVKVFKRHAPNVPVIVVTGLAYEEAEETARAGADDFITKPFDPGCLVRKIEILLDQRRLPEFAPSTTARLARKASAGVEYA